MADLALDLKFSALDALSKKLDAIADKFTALDGAAKGAGASASGRSAARPAYESGVATNLQKAIANFNAAGNTGNAEYVRNAHAKLRSAQASYDRAEKAINKNDAGLFSKIGTAISSSRISTNASGGIQLFPLVNKVAEVFGTELTLAVGAIGLMTQAAVAAGTALAQLAFATGSRGSTLGALSGLGLTGAQSAAFQSRITSDPIAQYFAASRLGQYNIQRPFGKLDEGKQLLEVVEALRKLSDDEALRTARATGTEELLKYRLLSGRQFDFAKGAGQVGVNIFGDPHTQTIIADFSSALESFGASVMNVLGAFGVDFLPGLTNTLNTMTIVMNDIALFVKAFQPIVEGLNNIFNPQTWGDKLGQAIGNAIHPQESATLRLNATMERTNTLLPGVYGNASDRINLAFPSAAGINSNPYPYGSLGNAGWHLGYQ